VTARELVTTWTTTIAIAGGAISARRAIAGYFGLESKIMTSPGFLSGFLPEGGLIIGGALFHAMSCI
jgi:hypothetical protein